MASRACLCGAANCARHRRRSHPSSSGAYGADHQERVRRLFASTPEICARCGKGPIPGDPWEGGHVDAVALGGGPRLQREHRSCNRRHGAQLKAALAKRKAEERAQRRIAETARLLQGRAG